MTIMLLKCFTNNGENNDDTAAKYVKNNCEIMTVKLLKYVKNNNDNASEISSTITMTIMLLLKYFNNNAEDKG